MMATFSPPDLAGKKEAIILSACSGMANIAIVRLQNLKNETIIDLFIIFPEVNINQKKSIIVNVTDELL
jgi:hypothetical protein